MKYRLLLFMIFSFLAFTVNSQNNNNRKKEPFKVVGYYFLRAAVEDTVHKDKDYHFLDKITHLNIAFINPDSNGHFRKTLSIDDLIGRAHAKKVKVLASIAGGGSHAYYSALLRLPKRKQLVADLTEIVLLNNLDGVDVDLEGADIDENYEPFIMELTASLRNHGKLITSAIATAYKDQFTDNALQQFDFINIMSYDLTGPWRPKDAGPHSPYEMAVRDLDYWLDTRKLPKEKVTLGLPFYGYVFYKQEMPVTSMTYTEIAISGGAAHTGDSLHLPENAVVYYNGPATIKNKTVLALNRAGGVMIWQILGDVEGEKGLLTVIKNTIKAKREIH